jgi:hypothetical protein
MSTVKSRKLLFPIIAFLLLDLFAVGVGMGVPLFAILLGLLVGWFSPSVLSGETSDLRHLLKKCLVAAFLTSGFTFFLMLVIWGPISRMLLDPSADLANFGIPFILYEARASFIGWIVLMMVISPFLQVLTTAFASSVRLAWLPPLPQKESAPPARQVS